MGERKASKTYSENRNQMQPPYLYEICFKTLFSKKKHSILIKWKSKSEKVV